MSKVQSIRFEPRRVVRGRRQRVRLLGDDHASRVVLTRGPDVFFELDVQRDEDGLFFVIDPPADSVRGVYNAVVHRKPVGRRVERKALLVLDEAWLSPRYPIVPYYDNLYFIMDEAGIPRKDMGGRVGYVRHPLVATYFALTYGIRGWAKGYEIPQARDGFWCIVRWLESILSEGPDGSLLIRHEFPLTVSFRLDPGWISGLTQGRVAEVFMLAEKLGGGDKYHELARRCCEIMRVPVERGGLVSTDRFGCVSIEEYPTRPGSWALNGIGSAVHSLETIAGRLELPWAADLIDRVCDSIGRKIPLFDEPDAPGSRVQLALQYDLRLRARSLLGTSPVGLTLHSVRVVHHAEAPTSVSGGEAVNLKKSGTGAKIDAGSAHSDRGELCFVAMLDGNRDAFDEVTDPSSTIELDITSSGNAAGSLSVERPAGAERLGRFRLKRGRQTISIRIDPHTVFDDGIGRVAKWNESYHTTNLWWMWQLSRYGADERVTHATRRWLLSLYTGVGRVPIDMAGIDLSPFDPVRDKALRAADGSDTPEARAGRMQVEMIDQLRDWADGTRPDPTLAYICPTRVHAGIGRNIRVFGFGFVGKESVKVDGAPIKAEVISADEIVAQIPPLNAGRYRLEVFDRQGTPIGESFEIEAVAEGAAC